MKFDGEKFISKIYINLVNSKEVNKCSLKKDNKFEKIRKYMNKLDYIHFMANTENRKEILYNMYYKKYLSNCSSKEEYETKKIRLTSWLDYLTNDDAKYPMWAKYWAFQGMFKIGTYNEQTETYMKRNIKTKAPFIEANAEIIAKCISKVIDDPTSIVSFCALYTKYILKYKKEINNKSNEGLWIKYNHGSNEDAQKLFNSLQGKNTGWCTASSLKIVKDQINGDNFYSGGDFYVYYTKDENNKFSNPRIAIRMSGHNYIDEIRGIEESQNVEECLIDTIKDKLDELNVQNKNIYMKLINNSNRLTYLNKKMYNNEFFNEDEFNYIMEKKSPIETFGWTKDKRINRLQSYAEKTGSNGENIFISRPEKIYDYLPKEKYNNLDCFINEYKNNKDISNNGIFHSIALSIFVNGLCNDSYFDIKLIKQLFFDYDPKLVYQNIFMKINNRDNILLLLTNAIPEIYLYFDDNIKNDKRFILNALNGKHEFNNIEVFIQNYKNNKDISNNELYHEIALRIFLNDLCNNSYFDTKLIKQLFSSYKPKIIYQNFFKDNKNDNILLLTMKTIPEIYLYIENNKKTDKKFIIDIVNYDSKYKFNDVSDFIDKFKKNKEINNNLIYIIAALSTGIDTDEILSCPDYGFWDNWPNILILIKINKKAYNYANEILKDDILFNKSCLSIDGSIFELIDDKFKNNISILESSFETYPDVLYSPNININIKKSFILKFAKYNYDILKYLPEDLRNDFDFMYELIMNNYEAFKYASNDLKCNNSFIKLVELKYDYMRYDIYEQVEKIQNNVNNKKLIKS